MRKITFLFILIASVFAFGQNKKIDSLLIVIQKDKQNLDVIRELSYQYENTNSGQSIRFAKLALKLSKELKNINEISTSYRDLGESYFMANKLDSAIVLLANSIENPTDNLFKYRVYVDLANCYSQKREMVKTKEFIDKATKVDELIKSADKIYLNKKLRLNLIKSQFYHNTNDYKNAFESANEALILSRKLNDKKRELRIMNTIANIYDSKGDSKKAIEIYKNLIGRAKIGDDTKSNISVWYYNLVNTLMKTNNFSDSKQYIDKGLKILETEPDDKMYAYFYLAYAQLFTKERKFENAIESIQKAEDHFKKNSIFVRIADCNYYRAKVFIAKEDFQKAEYYILQSVKTYESNGLTQELKDCYSILSEIKSKEKNYKEAFKYYKKYKETDDKIFSENKINAITNAEIKYETYAKELEIKSQQLELQKEKTNKYIALGGVGFLLLLSGGGFWFFKNKQKQNELKNQNTLLSLQQNLNAMELQSLNKQLDPHEIKNLLGSISPEIQEKAPEAYRKMLKLFNITKASLNNSSITDSVENQVRQVEDLLSLEKSMLVEPLEYSIKNKITNQELQIPRLMLKNLVENSIKHGIKGNESGGKIQVVLEEIGNFIEIKVDDTGKGRKHAISLDSGIGTSTYQNLFATLNKRNKESASFEIIDKEQGTKVEVKIPKDYQYS